MENAIEDFGKAFLEGNKASIETATKALFQDSLKFSSEEFSAIFDESTSLEGETGKWKLNGVSSEEVMLKLRSGELVELFEKMNVRNIDELSLLNKQKFFRKSIRNFPEFHLTELDEKFGGQVKNIEALNQKIEKLTEMNESFQKKFLKNAEKSKWVTLPKVLAFLAGAELTKVIVQTIANMNKMKGCYLYRMEDGKLEKYKIMNRSANTEMPKGRIKNYASLNKASNYLYNCTNLTLKIRQVLADNNLNGSVSKTKLMQILGNSQPDQIKKCINEQTKKLQQHFLEHPVEVKAPFDLLTVKEKKEMNCVACDPTAPIDSLNYTTREMVMDPVSPGEKAVYKTLPSDETLYCVQFDSVWDFFKNFGEETLDNLIDDFTDPFNIKEFLLTIGKYLILFVILYMVGSLAITYFTHS